ncbi:hypothetical protein [Trinickia mobilis]|uniref:hypothetical protein n=1 Tax=Trinickia mobilis TaxID=2816356 RepID=UPI001A8E3E08|nr:hypothetical protein [Trinickia mobilis]
MEEFSKVEAEKLGAFEETALSSEEAAQAEVGKRPGDGDTDEGAKKAAPLA